MVRYLIRRPVAVLITFLALVIVGLFSLRRIPVSLLPDVDIPQIVVRVDYPNASASILEQNIVRLIREKVSSLNNLRHLETRSGNHTGLLYLTFEYGTKMGLAYIEVNEVIDRISQSLPRDMPRPQVIRVNTSDVPIIRLQVIPKNGTSLLELSDLTSKILKKRLEQLDGVSLVDINGKISSLISVTPDKVALSNLGIDENIVAQTIDNANKEIGGLSVIDGQFSYFVNIFNELQGEDEISKLPIRLADGSIIKLSDVAEIRMSGEKQTGFHLYNGDNSLVVSIQKQPGSRMNDLVKLIKTSVEKFKQDYPQADFVLIRDQTFLLDAGINNLKQDLLYAGIFTILLLLMFLGNWASSLLMAISIPVSLVLTFILFYLFNISFNIISLSGLALGIGMLIDNSIVVIDNITRKRKAGLDLEESGVQGTNEVIIPVTSQVLTTVAVYVPLILLSGIAGALVSDQAVSLSISLGVSLLVAFVLAPLLYKLFLKTPSNKLRDNTLVYTWISSRYHSMINHILRKKLLYFCLTLLLMPIGFWLALKIPISYLPKIEKKESLVNFDWNESVDAEENLRRTKEIQSLIQKNCLVTEADVGIKQFILQHDHNTMQQTDFYFECKDEKTKLETDKVILDWVKSRYPSTLVKIIDAPNAFTQLFSSTIPYLEAKFKPINKPTNVDPFVGIADVLSSIPFSDYSLGAGMITEPSLSISLDYSKMAMYGITKSSVENVLKQQFGVYTVSEIRKFGEFKFIRMFSDRKTIESKLATKIKGANGAEYPLNFVVSISADRHQKSITADRSGEYRSISFSSEIKDKDINTLQKILTKEGIKKGFNVELTGQYFENERQIKSLKLIFLIVLALLYFILAVQYENLIQPIIVMLTIPLGVTGGMFLLWLSGGTLDIMAAIGFIVVLGLIVDDPILKVETLNRLEKQFLAQGLKRDDELLKRMIHEAGEICLKPLLLVSLTTSIAMVPVLFISGIGNDLQKPLALVIIGGLTIGTFFTTWFIPLSYWYVSKWINKSARK